MVVGLAPASDGAVGVDLELLAHEADTLHFPHDFDDGIPLFGRADAPLEEDYAGECVDVHGGEAGGAFVLGKRFLYGMNHFAVGGHWLFLLVFRPRAVSRAVTRSPLKFGELVERLDRGEAVDFNAT